MKLSGNIIRLRGLFQKKLDRTLRLTSLRSAVFSEYFHKLMNSNNIKSIRNGIKILIFFFVSEVITAHMAERSTNYRSILALCAFGVYFMIYYSTINTHQVQVMYKLASIMSVLTMIYTVLLGADPLESAETHYSLCIILILGMYTLFRLKFMITMLLSVVYILLTVSITNNRLLLMEKRERSPPQIERSLKFIRNVSDFILKRHNFIIAQCMLLILIYFTGFYLRFFNAVRRKSAFLKLVQNAEAKTKMQTAVKLQVYWIEAIMPAAVKNEFLNKIGNNDNQDFIYCKRFDNVSILFADIVGFTSMSSNKTAEQIVMLLNDLYNRFDEYGQIVNCEKLGTLGDCYYGVSGCPVARSDHAICCVEMGMGMCRIIKIFNSDHDENVGMRVGVHSGKVIAAIIGKHRFRFDVFSYDVIIANSLESSGRPGQVHISEDTYKLIRHNYVFRLGDELQVKVEESHGVGGYIQKIKPLTTYFLVMEDQDNSSPYHSIGRVKSNVREKLSHTNESNVKNYRMMAKDSILKSQNSKIDLRDEKIKHELEMIKTLESDPERPVRFFHNPPMSQLTLFFRDPEIEYHYLHHTIDQVKRVEIDSIKLALLFDSIACMVYSVVIMISTFLLIPEKTFNLSTVVMVSIALVVVIICIWTSLVYASEIASSTIRQTYIVLTHPLAKMIMSIYISSLPSIIVMTLSNTKIFNNYTMSCGFFTLLLFALIGNCIYSASYSVFKHLATLACTVGSIAIIMESKVDMEPANFNSCVGYLTSHEHIHIQRMQYNFLYQFLHVALLIYFLTRETEKNIRIYFYISREAEIRKDEARRARKIAESLLYNIIPRHVFSVIRKNVNAADMHFTYAQSVPNAGVVFACVSDFFNTFYREDYRDGEMCLRILHTIICRFDNLLRRPIYRDLEKIKTINDTYMIASGLHIQSSRELQHLVDLLMFAFDLRSELHYFNEDNMIGSYRFQLKIGFHCGPLTAGIIGISKPLYDVWGDTVNVASRMYSTTPLDTIQVAEEVSQKLSRFFEFKCRGFVYMKGKGNVVTYFVVRPIELYFSTNEYIDENAKESSDLT